MANALKIYSANEVSINFAGIPIDSGRGDDEFASWDQDEDSFTYKAGIDGEGTRSENRNRKTRVTLTLMQSSDGNAKLSAIHNGDVKVGNGLGVAPFMIRDRQGTTLLISPQAWVVKPPAQTRGKEVGTVQWLIDVHDPERFDGGN